MRADNAASGQIKLWRETQKRPATVWEMAGRSVTWHHGSPHTPKPRHKIGPSLAVQQAALSDNKNGPSSYLRSGRFGFFAHGVR